MRLAAIGIAMAVTALAARPAAACGPWACYPGRFVPSGGHVPANLPGFVWTPLRDPQVSDVPPDPASVTLVDADAPDAPIPLAAQARGDGSYVLVPATPLVAGKHYTLTEATECTYGGSTYPADFTTTDAAPLPTTLGTTMAGDDTVEDAELGGVGPCVVPAKITRANVELAFAAEALPWKAALLYTTTVDGALWEQGNTVDNGPAPGDSATRASTDTVYAMCSNSTEVGSTVAQGTHEVAFHATLANSALAIDATPATLALSCSAPPDAVDPGGAAMMDPAGCMSAAPSTPGWCVVALFAALGLRRRTEEKRA